MASSVERAGALLEKALDSARAIAELAVSNAAAVGVVAAVLSGGVVALRWLHERRTTQALLPVKALSVPRAYGEVRDLGGEAAIRAALASGAASGLITVVLAADPLHARGAVNSALLAVEGDLPHASPGSRRPRIVKISLVEANVVGMQSFVDRMRFHAFSSTASTIATLLGRAHRSLLKANGDDGGEDSQGEDMDYLRPTALAAEAEEVVVNATSALLALNAARVDVRGPEDLVYVEGLERMGLVASPSRDWSHRWRGDVEDGEVRDEARAPTSCALTEAGASAVGTSVGRRVLRLYLDYLSLLATRSGQGVVATATSAFAHDHLRDLVASGKVVLVHLGDASRDEAERLFARRAPAAGQGLPAVFTTAYDMVGGRRSDLHRLAALVALGEFQCVATGIAACRFPGEGDVERWLPAAIDSPPSPSGRLADSSSQLAPVDRAVAVGSWTSQQARSALRLLASSPPAGVPYGQMVAVLNGDVAALAAMVRRGLLHFRPQSFPSACGDLPANAQGDYISLPRPLHWRVLQRFNLETPQPRESH